MLTSRTVCGSSWVHMSAFGIDVSRGFLVSAREIRNTASNVPRTLDFSSLLIKLFAPELFFFLILAHSVYKM